MRFFSLLSRSAAKIATRRVTEICIQKSGGRVGSISEEELFRYTRHRWLFNEEAERSKRYRWFNLSKLVQAAIDAAGDGSHSCTRITKCIEGLNNKAFILTMNNGVEVFAKLPNPNAGPAFFTTASEVATRELLRDIFKLPIPRVLKWSADCANSVGAEYIIEEKASGVPLGSLWKHWPREHKLKIITQIVDLESRFCSMEFSQHGCVYFKKDLCGKIEENSSIILDSTEVDPDVLGRFTLGPLTSAELWTSGRDKMELDRGPWQDSQKYTEVLGLNEIAWITSHASPRANYHRSLREKEVPEDAISLLSKYMKVAPFLIPRTIAEKSNVLWHPDLHLDNVFVDPETHQITSIVDWQSATVAPLFYQSSVPRMFRHHKAVKDGWVLPERSENFESLSDEEQRSVDDDIESETLHKYYEVQVCKRSPLHWSVLSEKPIQILRKPAWLVTGMWENKDMFFLRQSLIELVAEWKEIFVGDNSIPCPISFTNLELELHVKEEENMDGVGQMLAMFSEQGILPVDGMVDAADYETALENSRKFKDVLLGLAKDGAERELFDKVWPYQDRQS